MTGDFRFVLSEREGDTVTIWLNRPDRLNVMSLAMMEELHVAFSDAGLSDATGVILAAKGVTPSQLALAWVLAQGDDVVPIPGTKRRQYLEENISALRIELSADDLASLDAAAPVGSSAGDRYADMSSVNR